MHHFALYQQCTRDLISLHLHQHLVPILKIIAILFLISIGYYWPIPNLITGKVSEITTIASNQSGPMPWVESISLKNIAARRTDRWVSEQGQGIPARKKGWEWVIERLLSMFAIEKL